MQLSKSVLIITTIISLTFGLGGCASSLIGVREGAERVSLADANQVAGCQSKGKTIVSVLTVVGFINRSKEDVEANLYQLARNDAVDAGADTLVKGESTAFGKRTFEMFKCRP
ncbi:MAG TPA: DUF4156 domain-containing protein [Gallionellaceae bacterium]|nr:DUF4156 domain-containing protein [Gallionellaceae bacterium]